MSLFEWVLCQVGCAAPSQQLVTSLNRNGLVVTPLR